MATQIEPIWTTSEACEVADLRRACQSQAQQLLDLSRRLRRSPVRGPAGPLAAFDLEAAAQCAARAARQLGDQAGRAEEQVAGHVQTLSQFGEGG